MKNKVFEIEGLRQLTGREWITTVHRLHELARFRQFSTPSGHAIVSERPNANTTVMDRVEPARAGSSPPLLARQGG